MDAWLKKYATKIAGTIAILSLVVMVLFTLTTMALVRENLSEIRQSWIGPDHYFVAFADNEGHLIARYEENIKESLTIEVPKNAYYIGVDHGGRVDNENCWLLVDKWVETG